MMARFLMWLASNYPYYFYRNIVLPDLSLFNKQELDREVKYAKTIPDFRENYMMKFAESQWLFNVYPQSFDSVKAEFAEWKEPCPLNQVQCKTYIVHGTKDKDPLAAAELAKAQIPNSELHLIQDGWHILDLHPEYDKILEGQL